MTRASLIRFVSAAGALTVGVSACGSDGSDELSNRDHDESDAAAASGSSGGTFRDGGRELPQASGGASSGHGSSGASSGRDPSSSGRSGASGRSGTSGAGSTSGRSGMQDGGASGSHASGRDAGRPGDATTDGRDGASHDAAIRRDAAVGGCIASQPVNTRASGTGPHKVTVETNAAPGIREGTIFRPTDLNGTAKYPIFVWGQGACSQNGLGTSAAMAEIASHGYFVIADGTPNGTTGRGMDGSNPAAMGKPLLAYVDWAIAQNDEPCSAYYQALDPSKVAANGFSCGGLMAEGTAGDPRMTTWGLNSSGSFGANDAFYDTIHTPVLIVLGGPSDIAYSNGKRDFDEIGSRGIPIVLFSKNIGHGGDLFGGANGGDFTKINLAWLNWWLKGDETATGKGFLIGNTCSLCKNPAWEYAVKNLQ